MKKTNKFWVLLPVLGILFSNALQVNAATKENTKVSVVIVKPEPTQLNLAISNGDLSKVQELVGKGVNINDKDERGKTPLMYAILYKQTDIISFLIQNGAKLTTKDSRGFVVSDYAKKSKSATIIKIIEEARKRK
jgi:ankyrin repeat protein